MSKKIDWEEGFDFGTKKLDNKDIIKLVSKLINKWYWFAASLIVCISFSFLVLRYSIPMYNVKAKLLVSDDKKGGLMGESALADLSGIMGTKSSVDNEVEVLSTSDLMYEMVIEEDAFIQYFKVGKVHDIPTINNPFTIKLLTEPDSIKISETFNIFSNDNKRFELNVKDSTIVVYLNKPFSIKNVGLLELKLNPNINFDSGIYGFTISPIRKTVEHFNKLFNAEVTNKNVSTINLSFQHAIPKRGEQLLRTLINKYVELNLNDKNIIADSTLSFINSRLSKITDELAGVEDRISGYKQSKRITDISEQSKILIQNSSNYTNQIAELDVQVSSLDEVLNYLTDVNNPRILPSTVLPNDVSFTNLVTRYNELILQKERLLMANTEDNPLVLNIKSQISGLREDMISNIISSKKSIELAKDKETQIVKLLTSEIQNVPTIERGYIDLARLQQIKQAQYIFLQEKWEETAIGRTANVANSKVIDSPKSEELPFSPKSKVIYILGIIMGFLIPLATIYLKNIFNIRVQGLDDIQKHPDLNVLGMIAHSDEEDQVVVTKTSRSPIAEQFRAMRTNLEFALNGGKSILFTSSMSGEGKSYIALNLAVTLALLNKKVVLMELDLRKPSITTKLGLPAGKGFSHYVVRPEMKIEEIIMPSGSHDNVDLIQAGAIPPNPAELLLHDRTQELMLELANRYDYILIDAPPVGMVTDAQLLSRYADSCLYIIRQGYTFKDQLNIPNELLRSKKINNIQLVVNDVDSKASYYSNYGYGYGYGYGYYGDMDKSKSNFSKLIAFLFRKK